MSFKCEICGSTFEQENWLTEHMRTHTGDKPYEHGMCKSTFMVKGGLTKHMRIHTGEKPYKCDVCGSTFSKKGQLTVHMRVHTGDKPYKCDVCGSEFSQKGTLTKHNRMHIGDKPYVCEVCGSAFTAKGSLTKHNRIHTGYKPYKCDVCGSTFSQKGHLTVHMRIHTGDKPYVCEICGSAFTVKSNLTMHMRLHTGDKPYTCDVCGSAFSQGPPGPHQGPPHQGPPHQGPPGPGPNLPPASNVTNDPRGAHCRIFVGNLNTIAMKKEDVEAIFRRYGMVTGISMHKGYAFVQYGSHDEAKRASMSEDGKTYAGQTLDINIASEPKKGSKRAATPVMNANNKDAPAQKKLRTDVDSSKVANAGGRNLVSLGTSLKDATIEASSTSITLSKPTGKALRKTTISTGNDILICGNCKSLHSSLATFVQHKKQKCELKIQCKCQQIATQEAEKAANKTEPERTLLCAVCDVVFKTAWDLCQHCQEEHSIEIFKELKAEAEKEGNEVNGDKDKE